MPKARRLIIKGKVQGVYYRDSTKSKALELGIKGWVRNLPNGDVEALIVGEPPELERMIEWAWDGPPMAVVRDVIIEEADCSGSFDGFEVRH
ncbi:MAG TPA: acylphosphatase [Candidatus Methanofastidiosa archaeon]|nr:acylphosphatase [Candidatus Methanofastidiosa archaeon]HPR42498.1 acylphosphatase [Candidatus Methanofastidiosa archaeon]